MSATNTLYAPLANKRLYKLCVVKILFISFGFRAASFCDVIRRKIPETKQKK